MLEGLDRVPWSTLTHAYGPADDVPALLEELTSFDAKTRSSALGDLYSNIYHQGTVYEATSHAVPFLIELVAATQVPDRAHVLHLLASIATGSSYHAVHGRLMRPRRREPEDLEAVTRRELGWVKAAHDAVVEGVPTFLELLQDRDAEIRAVVPFLLSALREAPRREVLRTLRDAIEREREDGPRASAVMALALLGGSDEVVRGVLERLVTRESPAVVRLAAAIPLVPVTGGTSSRYLDTIVDDLDSARVLFSAGPWSGRLGDTLSSIGELLGELDVRIELLARLLGSTESRVRLEAIDAAWWLSRRWRKPVTAFAPRFAALLKDGELAVREAAAEALAGSGEAARPFADDLVVALDDASARVRLAAIRTLLRLKDARVLPLIRVAVERDPVPVDLLRLLYRVGPWCAAALVPTILLRLDALPETAALVALGEMRDPRAMPALMRALEDEKRVRAATSALRKLGARDERLVEALLSARLLEHEDFEVRIDVVVTLWRAGHWTDALGAILSKALELDRHVRQRALEAIEDVGESARALTPNLRRLLEHDDPRVRVHSARALWRLDRRADEVLPCLLPELSCSPAGVLVAECLGEIGPLAKAALPELRRALESKQRLVEVGTAADWIDEDERYQRAASVALARIEGREREP